MIDNFELGLSSIPLVTPVLLDRSGQPITGSTTIVAEIRRIGTSDRWDFNDNTFKTSGWTTRQGALAQVDASLDAGVYERAAGWVATAVVAGVYLVTYRDTSGLALPASEAFRLGGPAETVATKLDVTTGSRAAAGAEMALVNDAITAAKIATDAFDAASFKDDAVTKIQNGLATTAQLGPLALEATLTAIKGATFDSATDSLEALRNRGDAAWITANISGLATTVQLDAHALAIKGATFNTLTDSLEAIRDRGDAAWVGSTAGDVATAVWVTAEGGAVGTIRYAITLLRKRQTNRRKMGVDGYESSYDDDNVTVLKKSLVKDINGDIVVPGDGDPSEVLAEIDP